MLKMTVRGVKKLQRDLKVEGKRQVKAMQTAVKVEGFRLRRVMKKEIRAGAPGGKRFARLSMMRRIMLGAWTKSRRLGVNRPLASLSKSVGYKVDYHPFQLAVGFVDSWASSVTWRRLARMHQDGFDTSVNALCFRGLNKTIEQVLREEGAAVDHKLFGGRKSRRRNVFFLRKPTQRLRTPARPIIEPFWAAHKSEAMPNIRKNFRLKLQGKRI